MDGDAAGTIGALKTALIFSGSGASLRCQQASVRSLTQHLPDRWRVKPIDLSQLADALRQPTTQLLLLPGGADRYYLHTWQTEHCRGVRQFVQRGGCFIGICAGAYFACQRMVFLAQQGVALQGPRPLRLVKACAVGPLPEASHYREHSEQGSAAIALRCQLGPLHAYYNGGPWFIPAGLTTSSWRSVAQYASNQRCAILRTCYGRGTVLLLGVHLEWDDSDCHRLGTAWQVRHCLRAQSTQRSRFWRRLLRECCHNPIGTTYAAKL